MAAVMSDNDGAAFITKAEFDSLKNVFQNQINQYNANVDNKIDGAISSYLSGAKISKKSTCYTEHQTGGDKWNYVKMMNFTPVEIQQVPNLNLNFGVYGTNLYYTGLYRMAYYTNADLTYAAAHNSVATRNRKNCVDLGTEPGSTGTVPDICGWRGRCYDLEDSIIAYKQCVTPKIWRTEATIEDTAARGYLRTPNVSRMDVVRALQINSGYFNKNNIYQNWKATVYYKAGDSDGRGSFYANGESWTDYVKAAFNSAIKLNKVNGEEYFDKHILNWKSINFQRPTEPTWSSWFGGLTSLSQDDVLKNKTTKVGIWGVHETGPYSSTAINQQYTIAGINSDNRTYSHQAFGNWYSGEDEGTTTADMKGVGVVEKTFASSAILQWFKEGTDNKYELNRDGTIKVDAMDLLNGYLVGSVKKDEIFEWEPTISGFYFPYTKSTHYHSYTKRGTTYYQYGDYCLDGNCTNTAHHVTAVPKWRIVLATCYFGEGTNIWTNMTIDGRNNGKIIKEEGQTTDYKELDNGSKVKFKFKASDNCIVVAKWFPAGMKQYGTETVLNPDDCYWYGSLDLTQCGTYYVTSS